MKRGKRDVWFWNNGEMPKIRQMATVIERFDQVFSEENGLTTTGNDFLKCLQNTFFKRKYNRTRQRKTTPAAIPTCIQRSRRA